MKILLSNDDGVHARGLKVLYEHLKTMGDVWVSAPLEEKSTTGHSLTLHKPLRVHEIEKRFYGVSGSPADCVYVGVRELMKNKPDLVVSGINRGANLGQDVYYSGTVSAAREACMMGIPSIAVSLAVNFSKKHIESKLHYDAAAATLIKMLKTFDVSQIPKHSLLNLNVPDLPLKRVKGIKPARQGFRFYSGNVIKRVDHRGRPYFWVGGQYKGFEKEAGTDCTLVDSGWASLTPIKLDTTDFSFLSRLQDEEEFF